MSFAPETQSLFVILLLSNDMRRLPYVCNTDITFGKDVMERDVYQTTEAVLFLFTKNEEQSSHQATLSDKK